MKNNLKNKVVLITGGGAGLGAETGKILAKEGARVILGDIYQEKAEKVAKDIVSQGGQAEGILLDVSNDDSCLAARQHIADSYGGLDILVNNAACDVTAPFKDLTMEQFDKVLKVNLRGPIFLSKIFLSDLEKQEGQIINVASTASKRMWPNATAYHATKWGLVGFSHALYTEARNSKVKVTAVVPGGMKTPHLLDRFPDIDQTKLQDAKNVADVIKFILLQPKETIIPEVMVLPLFETSWP